MTTISQFAELLSLLEKAPTPSTDLDKQIHAAFADCPEYWFSLPEQLPYTSSIDACRALIKATMPGWIYRVAECSVSDDAWLIPDFNDPVMGARFIEKFSVEHQRDPVAAFGTDIDRRPPGNPALAMCMALVTAKIAVMKLEN